MRNSGFGCAKLGAFQPSGPADLDISLAPPCSFYDLNKGWLLIPDQFSPTAFKRRSHRLLPCLAETAHSARTHHIGDSLNSTHVLHFLGWCIRGGVHRIGIQSVHPLRFASGPANHPRLSGVFKIPTYIVSTA